MSLKNYREMKVHGIIDSGFIGQQLEDLGR